MLEIKIISWNIACMPNYINTFGNVESNILNFQGDASLEREHYLHLYILWETDWTHSIKKYKHEL